MENLMFVSTKTVLSHIIPRVNRNGNRLYNMLPMKVDLPSFCFHFRVSLLTSDLF